MFKNNTILDVLRYITLFVVLSIYVSCGESVSKSNEVILEIGWLLVEKENYSIAHPKEWSVDMSGRFGVDLFLFSPKKDSADTFKENVNLYIEDLQDANVDQNAYFEISKKQLASVITDAKLLESSFISELGAHRNIFIGKQGVLAFKSQQYYWVADEKAYVVTLTCQESEYENYKTLGEKIIATFTIK